MGALQPWHLIILVLIVVLLFGAKRLPDAARSVGKSMKIFKAETKDMRGSDGESEDSASSSASTTSATSATPATEPETRQLPTSSTDNNDKQVEDLQRQLDDLKKQQNAS